MKYDLEKVIVVEYDDKLQADLEKVLTRMGGKQESKTFSNLELNRLKNQPKAKPKAKPKPDLGLDVIERTYGYRFKEELDSGDRIYYDPNRQRQVYFPLQDLDRSFQIAREKLAMVAKYKQEAEMRQRDKQRRINQQVNRDLIRKTYS